VKEYVDLSNKGEDETSVLILYYLFLADTTHLCLKHLLYHEEYGVGFIPEASHMVLPI